MKDLSNAGVITFEDRELIQKYVDRAESHEKFCTQIRGGARVLFLRHEIGNILAGRRFMKTHRISLMLDYLTHQMEEATT